MKNLTQISFKSDKEVEVKNKQVEEEKADKRNGGKQKVGQGFSLYKERGK